jgi:hypothetical protein
MRPTTKDSRPAEWEVRSVSVPRRDAARRLEQVIRFLLGSSADTADPSAPDRSTAHACRRLRPGLDRPAEPRSDD